jgi:protein SCO1/2
MMRRTLLSLAALSLCLGLPAQGAEPHTDKTPFELGEAPQQAVGGPLDLLAHTGKPFSLKQLQGSPVLVYFGFKHCSDTCPMALTQARALLAANNPGKPPVVVFVTLDPMIDTPPILAEYMGRFDKRIIALTGSLAQIDQAAQRYGITTRGSGAGMQHTSRWFLLDGQLKVIRIYPWDTPGIELAHDIARAQADKGHAYWK